MKKRDVKKLLKDNPEFASWLKNDPGKMSEIRSNPNETVRLMARWKTESKRKSNPLAIDFEALSDKSKRASEMLSGIQSVMEMIAEYSKKESGKL